MELMQFTAIVVMFLLTLTLIMLLPRRVVRDHVFSRSRWQLAGGTSLLCIQFLLQYELKLRAMGVTQGVFLNLLIFVPCSWMLALAILNLQRQGHIRRSEWLVGAITYALIAALLMSATAANGMNPLDDTPAMRYAEIASAALYTAMTAYYTVIELRELRRMHRSLDNYYDLDMGYLLQWMERSILVLVSMALLAPLAIFNNNILLSVFGLAILFGIYYFVISFICYVVSNDAHDVTEANTIDGNDDPDSNQEMPPLTDEELLVVGKAVQRWLARGRHLQCGINIKTASDEMKVPRYKLMLWLKTTPQELFSPWLTNLRTEAAKQMLREHPDWTNDTIAQMCGFSTRNYFQTVFRKQTGMTPAQFIASQKAK
ncbi:MAG: helix-turn-helix domain-containing protein [Bacteroidales bacterium]|nr:helix-turn-helix domain-containing protein [Bacteroidales bacterium]